jgi:YHS domain-containing protein
MVQNLWWAAGYNILAIPLAAGILYDFGIVVSPAIGALIMSLSTVIVAINSQTLRKYEPHVTEVVEKTHVTTDPVCGMPVTPEDAFSHIEHENYVLYFCSEKCATAFQEHPDRYLQQITDSAKPEPMAHTHHH